MVAGLAFLAVAFALAAAAAALGLIDRSGEHASATSTGADIAILVSMVGIAAAFGLAARATRAFRENRDASVARAAWLAAGAFAIGFVGVTYQAVVDAGEGLPASGVAGGFCGAAAQAWYAVAALVAARAFVRAAGGGDRDPSLARAGVCLGIAFAFGVAEALLAARLFDVTDVFSAGGIVAGLLIMAAGSAVCAAACVAATVGFAARRERVLALAANLFASGNVVFAVGLGIFAASFHGSGLSNTGLVMVWLLAASGAGTAAGAVCFVVALRRSRRGGAAAAAS